jgi:hypothetical protein
MTPAARKPAATYCLRLRSLNADARDDVHMLKGLLKVALRKYQFRCIDVKQEQPFVREKQP